MDSDREIARAKWLLLFGAVFLVSAFLCYGEMVYLFVGREAQATVKEAYVLERRGRFGIPLGEKLVVEYSFTEPDGTSRSGHDEVTSSWPPPENGIITVRYTPGKDGRSRLAGHVNWTGLALFALSTALVIYAVARLWQLASRAVKGKPSSKAM